MVATQPVTDQIPFSFETLLPTQRPTNPPAQHPAYLRQRPWYVRYLWPFRYHGATRLQWSCAEEVEGIRRQTTIDDHYAFLKFNEIRSRAYPETFPVLGAVYGDKTNETVAAVATAVKQAVKNDPIPPIDVGRVG